MIPINNHVQIEPEKHEDFIVSGDNTYNEIGRVVAVASGISNLYEGDRVYFDAWMAAKYPAGDGKLYWLIPYDNVKAVDEISEKRVQGGLPPQISYSTPTGTRVD